MQTPHWNSRFTLLSSAAAVAVLASACGGGSGSSSSPVASASSVALSGNAATGLALAGATVSIKCATGSGTATTASTGAYTATLANAVLPCVLKVTSSDGLTTLHSVAAGSGGGTVVANLTPLTELVLAQAAGQAPAAFFNGFSSAQLTTLSASTLDAALAAVASALNSAVSIGTLNPFTAPLTPATAANPAAGNAYDQLLDQLAVSVANAQTSLSALTAQMAAGSTSTLGTSLQSSLAADFAAGIFDLDFGSSANRWEAEVHRSTSGPVNGEYTFAASRYAFVNGAWGADSSSDSNYILTPSGWLAQDALPGTARQVGLDRFVYTDATESNKMTMATSSPTSFALADLPGGSGLSGTVVLPAGAKFFSFTSRTLTTQYQLNGGSGFSNTTSLADLRTQYSSAALQWMGGNAGALQWRFGSGTASGPLYLSTAGTALADGSWELVTVQGVQLMVLNFSSAANATSGLATGQKFFYAVAPGGNVQEGRYRPAGSAQTETFTNVNRIAANAILAAIGLASLPN